MMMYLRKLNLIEDNMIKVKKSKVELLEEQLAELCEEIYLQNLGGKRIRPLPPKVIVRVLPKEHRTESGLYIPGAVSNKPIYEGIVLETWEWYDEIRVVKHNVPEGEPGPVHFDEVKITHRCPVNVGDRVAFAHFEGQPLKDYLDDKYYRVILDSVILGTLDYKGDKAMIKPLKKLMERYSSITLSGAKEGPGVPHWEPPAKSDWFQS
jgi:co-chaperonin GroES (HSP10)